MRSDNRLPTLVHPQLFLYGPSSRIVVVKMLSQQEEPTMRARRAIRIPAHLQDYDVSGVHSPSLSGRRRLPRKRRGHCQRTAPHGGAAVRTKRVLARAVHTPGHPGDWRGWFGSSRCPEVQQHATYHANGNLQYRRRAATVSRTARSRRTA